MHRSARLRVLSTCLYIGATLFAGAGAADPGKAGPYLTPQLQKRQIFADVFSKALEVRGEGFEPYSGRYSGTAAGIVTLEREGSGSGKSQDDERKLPITVKGKKLDATVKAGTSTWSGLTTLQHGLILNDEILIRRPVTLQTEAGSFSGEETEYTLLNLMPNTGVSYTAG